MAAPTFKEWIAQQKFSIDQEDAEKLINAYLDFKSGSMHCGICGKELTLGERLSIRPDDFTITCSQHIQYRTSFQIPEQLKIEAGYYSEIKHFFS